MQYAIDLKIDKNIFLKQQGWWLLISGVFNLFQKTEAIKNIEYVKKTEYKCKDKSNIDASHKAFAKDFTNNKPYIIMG